MASAGVFSTPGGFSPLRLSFRPCGTSEQSIPRNDRKSREFLKEELLIRTRDERSKEVFFTQSAKWGRGRGKGEHVLPAVLDRRRKWIKRKERGKRCVKRFFCAIKLFTLHGSFDARKIRIVNEGRGTGDLETSAFFAAGLIPEPGPNPVCTRCVPGVCIRSVPGRPKRQPHLSRISSPSLFVEQ